MSTQLASIGLEKFGINVWVEGQSYHIRNLSQNTVICAVYIPTHSISILSDGTAFIAAEHLRKQFTPSKSLSSVPLATAEKIVQLLNGASRLTQSPEIKQCYQEIKILSI